MCGEMLKDSTAPEMRLYAKTLTHLELSSNETVRADLQSLLQQLVQVLTRQSPTAILLFRRKFSKATRQNKRSIFH